MNKLIKVNFNDEQGPTVSGRDLHEALEIRSDYMDWFPRMCEYGFIEETDYISNKRKSTGDRPVCDHILSLDMAKQICIMQRTEIGKIYREYFLELERKWNAPETVMERALFLAKRQLDELLEQNEQLTEENAVQAQQITEMSSKVSYYDVCLADKDPLPISLISMDYGCSENEMNQWLADQGVQYRKGSIWLLNPKYANRGYTQTKTDVYISGDGEPLTIVHMYWTQKGRLFIYDLMTQAGHLPTMEQNTTADSVSANNN